MTTLIVRGDLQSETGWSRATRALLAAIESDFELIVGVDLHFHPQRSQSVFPFAIVSDDASRELIKRMQGAVVLHVCMPGEAIRFSDAVNVIWWFWETDRLPQSDWLERLDAMDLILVPSAWQAGWLKELGLRSPVAVVPWPHRALNAQAEIKGLPNLDLSRVVSLDELAKARSINQSFDIRAGYCRSANLRQKKSIILDSAHTSFTDAFEQHDGYFLAVQTDAPRKGLPVLISEWRRYRRESNFNYALIIKFSSLNVDFLPIDKLIKFSTIAWLAAQCDADALSHVYVVIDHLSDATMHRLYANATAFIVASYGEGFGGTIVEAAQLGCPCIAPRHTATGQLVADDHPLSYESLSVIGALIDQLPIQPINASWHPPRPGSIAEGLLYCEKLSTEKRREISDRMRSYIFSILAPERVYEKFRSALSSIVRSPPLPRAS